jgi:hypothetical protein
VCLTYAHGLDVSDVTVKVVLAQKERDAAIDHLVEVMNDVYDFVHEAEPLKKIESQKQIVALITQQTTQCAYFIRDYSTNKNFCMSIFDCASAKFYLFLQLQGKEWPRI